VLQAVQSPLIVNTFTATDTENNAAVSSCPYISCPQPRRQVPASHMCSTGCACTSPGDATQPACNIFDQCAPLPAPATPRLCGGCTSKAALQARLLVAGQHSGTVPTQSHNPCLHSPCRHKPPLLLTKAPQLRTCLRHSPPRKLASWAQRHRQVQVHATAVVSSGRRTIFRTGVSRLQPVHDASHACAVSKA
jgi:hypothetical protein